MKVGATVEEVVEKPNEAKATVMSLLERIRSGDEEEIKRAVMELRLLSKWEMSNRIVIGEAGSIPLIVSLLRSSNSKVQENAVTTLLNLSICPANRTAIMETGDALESISEVLKAGATSESKENCAALLSSLLIAHEHRDIIGRNSALLESLRDLLQNGRVQGKKDAIRAIFHLALWPKNRTRLVIAGVLSPLRMLLGSPRPGLVEDTLSVLAQIARCKAGAESLGDPGTISLIIEFLQHGSTLAKENATALLLSLCDTGGFSVQNEVRRHKENVIRILCTMLTDGSPRAMAKANDLLKVVMGSRQSSFTSRTSE